MGILHVRETSTARRDVCRNNAEKIESKILYEYTNDVVSPRPGRVTTLSQNTIKLNIYIIIEHSIITFKLKTPLEYRGIHRTTVDISDRYEAVG